MLRYAKGDDIEDARAAAPLSLANLPGESETDAYCVVASAVDLLGNESSLPGKIDDGECMVAGMPDDDEADMLDAMNSATFYEMLLEDLNIANRMPDDAAGSTTTPKADAIEAAMDKLADTGLRVGVDITPPGIEIDELDRFDDPVEILSFSFAYYDDLSEDSNSGLHSSPLLVSAQKRNTSMTDCLDISDGMGVGVTPAGAVGTTSDDCDDPTALGEDVAVGFGTPPDAYYTLWGTTRDKAGNHSETVSHTFVVDTDPGGGDSSSRSKNRSRR